MSRSPTRPALAALPAVIVSVIALACLALPAAAQSQWQWRDANGRMVYSDVPPPPSVPAHSMIKVPGRFAGQFRPVSAEPANESATPARAAPSVVPVSAPSPSAEAAFQQRREAQRKAEAEESKLLQAQQERQARCTGLRNYAAALQQGRRTAVAAPDGSLQPMDSAQREAELLKANEDLGKFCA
jgi:hypothetical protein